MVARQEALVHLKADVSKRLVAGTDAERFEIPERHLARFEVGEDLVEDGAFAAKADGEPGEVRLGTQLRLELREAVLWLTQASTCIADSPKRYRRPCAPVAR